MTFLVLVTQAPDRSSVHRYVGELIEAIYQQGHRVKAVFFTSVAAIFGTNTYNAEQVNKYLDLAQNYRFPLLICGRAFRKLGQQPQSLHAGFELSGNLELTVMLQECDKTVEF